MTLRNFNRTQVGAQLTATLLLVAAIVLEAGEARAVRVEGGSPE
jgi:hypothetical protein